MKAARALVCVLLALGAAEAASARDERSTPRTPAFSLHAEPVTVPQGGILRVITTSLTGGAVRRTEAVLDSVKARGVAWSAGDVVAFVPVGHALKLGPHPVAVTVVDAEGDTHHASLVVNVVAGDFDTDELGVGRSFTDPSRAQRRRAAADSAAFQKVWQRPAEPRHWRGPFLLPVDNVVTARFGTFRTINGRTRSRHLGIDVRGANGDTIRAANDGRVVMARDCFFSGNTVVVDHGQDVHTLYFHLSRFQVKEGQMVKRGQPLGRVGSTGRVTGPHLHWGVKLSRTYVDPLALLGMDLGADPLLAPARRAEKLPAVRLLPPPAGSPRRDPSPGRDEANREFP